MILSALLTSVGINFGLCLLFFTLYSVLRKQPGNAYVYAPRLVAEGKSPRSDFNLERFLPSASWVRKAWETSEEELLALSGLDGVVFMRIFIFSIKVFSFAMIIGFILLPINFLGNQLTMDYSDLPNKSLESFSISNVNDGSNRLWIHFSAAYIFTGFVCYLLYSEFKYISSKRITCFYSSEPKIHQFTVLVRGIPVSSGISFSESVENFFTLYYPSTYLSHVIVRRTSTLRKLIAEFFIAYVVTTGWTSTSSELFQLIKLIWNFIRRNILGREDDQLAVPSANYYSKIPKILLFGLLGITYLFLAPLILPFLLVYFCLGYIVFRNQLLTVYSPKHETNGNFWPIVHNSTICSLVLMHIIAIGIFGLKKIPLASGLMIPLPVMTLLFNNYCQRRFIPLFKSYPAECLIKKDRDDQSSGTMDAFYEKLVAAYRDPALAPIQTSGNSDGRTSPLLQATEV